MFFEQVHFMIAQINLLFLLKPFTCFSVTSTKYVGNWKIVYTISP